MTHPLISHFQMRARYNALANEKLYSACARLSDSERKQRRQAFFTSIHGALNHILLGDRIWLARFAGQQAPSTGLDAVLYEEFQVLLAARRTEDARIDAFADGLTEAFLAGSIRLRQQCGQTLRRPHAAAGRALFQPSDPSPRPGARPAHPDRGAPALPGPAPRPEAIAPDCEIQPQMHADKHG